MNVGTLRWVGTAAVLVLVGIAGLLGHVVLADELGPLSYVVLTLSAIVVGLGIGHTAAEAGRRRREEVERHNAELSALNAVAVTASRSLELTSVLRDCLEKTLEVMKLEAGALVLSSDTGAPTMGAHRGLSDAYLSELLRTYAGGDGSTAIVVPERPTSGARLLPLGKSPQVSASICVPLRAEGREVGAMYLYSPSLRAFSERDEQILVAIADVIGMAVQNAKLHAQVWERSIRDPLTGLYNRRYFDQIYHQEVERARRYGVPLTLAMIDIDHFKEINDRFGHKMGDEVLVGVATVLREGRVTDIACRYGGDEFLVLMPNTDLRGARAVAERIRRLARAMLVPGALDHGVDVSIGLADSARGYDQILERADARMYLEKRRASARGLVVR